MIKVTILNATHAKIDCDRDILLFLSEHFAFQAKNYQHSPKYKYGLWDGKIRLFNINTQLLPKGLLSELEKVFDENGWQYQITNNVSAENNTDDAEHFLKTVPLPPHIKEIDPAQELALKLFVSMKTLFALAPTAAGKSLIMYLCSLYCQTKLGINSILIIVPSKKLSEQLYKNFLSYNRTWTEKNVHRIYSGMEKDWDNPITICTFQTLGNLESNHFHKYDCVIVDEGHKAKAVTITSILNNCINAYYRLGLTGTLKDSNLDKLQIEGLIGPIKRLAHSKELEDRGRITKTNLVGVKISHTTIPDKKTVSGYHNEMKWLTECESRNQFIAKSITGKKGNSLVLTMYVSHVERLAELIRLHGKTAYTITGPVSIKEREQIEAACSSDSDIAIVSTYGCMSTGVDIPELKIGYFATAYEDGSTMLQCVGRMRRMTESKRESGCQIIDFYDSFSDVSKSRKTFSEKHFNGRLNAYVEDGAISMKFIKINLT